MNNLLVIASLLLASVSAAPLEPEVQHLLTSSPPPLLRLSSYSSSSLLLTCSASGSPLPSFTWLKDGLPIAPTSTSSAGLGETVSTLRVPCPRQAVYTCVATSGAHTEEAHTRVLPTEPEGDGIGQWEEVEEHSLEEKEEGVCKEQVLTWATSLLVPEGELALLPCQAGEEVRWDRQGEPIEGTLSGNLVIPNVQFSLHMDLYTCTVARTGQEVTTFLYPFQPETRYL